MLKKVKLGPGVLITSAFIGPGTVTLCLLAGVQAGLELLWAVIFSTLATIVLQDMCVRLGYYSRKGLEQNIIAKTSNPVFNKVAIVFILVAILFGNAAYQSGNIAGAKLGLQMMDIGLDGKYIFFVIYAFIMFCAWKGSYDILKKILGFLVFIMSIAFILIALIKFPNFIKFLEGSFIPKFQNGHLFLIIGLIGTTVVPYNLFLHTTLVANQHEIDIKALRKDSFIAILLGGLISMSLVIIGSNAQGLEIKNAAGMAEVLNNTTGVYSKYLLGIGLFAAGLSSALTAPMAAALVSAGVFNWKADFNDNKMKYVSYLIMTIGFLVSVTQANTIKIIKVAQVINGLFLPIFAAYLIWTLNDRDLLRVHKNTPTQNTFGVIILFVTLLLAFKSILNYIS